MDNHLNTITKEQTNKKHGQIGHQIAPFEGYIFLSLYLQNNGASKEFFFKDKLKFVKAYTAFSSSLTAPCTCDAICYILSHKQVLHNEEIENIHPRLTKGGWLPPPKGFFLTL